MWKPRTYIHTCFRALFIFITQCGNLVQTYMFSGIVHIHHSVWKPRTYICVFRHCSYSSLSVETSYLHKCFRHCSYSSLSVETSYLHTCFLALFIFITKCGNLVHTYMFSGIVHIHHSVWKPRTYIHVFWHCSYSSLSVDTSYIHTCFQALFIFITKWGNLVHT